MDNKYSIVGLDEIKPLEVDILGVFQGSNRHIEPKIREIIGKLNILILRETEKVNRT
jgi:hypothetical protein